MLYPKNNTPLTPELFKNPTSEYRGTPFWAWNTVLQAEELTWQIEQFKKMGYGGFHMHVRTGMATEYLSKSFMELVKTCVEKARKEEMLAWLYDEDRWPSGAAGGLVTKDEKYRARHLLLTRVPYGQNQSNKMTGLIKEMSNRAENGKLIACYDICLDENGVLASYSHISEDDKPKGFKLYAYEEAALPSPWFNNQAYVDTLNPEAIAKFIETTYEPYREAVSKDFGGVVPAIFTDEPQFTHKKTLGFAQDESDLVLPWTSDIPSTYSAAYGEDILSTLPELLWDLPAGKPSQARYRYHDHIAERFAAAFADQCGNWCEKHGLALTGHMMEEPTLQSQTAALGEAMRSYRSFQLPGIDMLCDWREFTTAKQAQSAARQYNRPGVMSELYGVTNWDFDFRGHKLQGDWQAALGITVRVPHLSWVSMNGEAKRDYPSTFNYQSPWFEEYPYIEDHYARVNTAMTRGKAVCRVGVIHPVESYWLHWGARETTAAIRGQMEENFLNITDWLLKGCIDFDFISESLLPDQCQVEDIGKQFPVGHMNYDIIIAPGLETMRATTLERLTAFVAKEGHIIFLGAPPKYVDAVPNPGAKNLCKADIVPFNRLAILEALKYVREVEIRDASGVMTNDYIYQLREEENHRWLFIANASKPVAPDSPVGQVLNIKVQGSFSVTKYDSLTGEIVPLPAATHNGVTEIKYPFYEHDSLLLRLDPGISTVASAPITLVNPSIPGKKRFMDPVPVTLHEPNVLLLDMAEYSLSGEPYRSREEILRLDNILRGEMGWPLREDAFAQPWVENDESTPAVLKLRFAIQSEIAVQGAALAFENAGSAHVTLNGQPAAKPDGWYVDKCIKKVGLPDIHAGENILELTIPYGRKVDIEACYLLGDFGVRVAGWHCVLTPPVRTLCFGDIVPQGLPFYGGNITYHLETEIDGDELTLAASYYRGHLLLAAVDGNDAGVIAFSPYRLKVDGLAPGKHKIDITYFGSRVNTFGQLHRMNRTNRWWGPNSWRTTGDDWTYEYRFWPQGVLKSVEVF
ncbi:MAG: hypothetical protein FWE42_07995 [Defluviitaleaceae bacterium]|nr:hypothetical protein [Defluviitaleaceae bacterium]